MADRVGQQLGNYRLIRLLGHGGFADVYLGEHIHLNTQAAIKMLHTRLESNEIERFRDEARTIARLYHPHIVRVLEFGVEGRVPFLVMDYAPGGSLRKLHSRGTQLPLETVVSYVKQVASALQYAHDEKLIHRDIKPENMLLGRHNEVLLSDFGLALVAQSARSLRLEDIVGTIAYMAPEQIEAHPLPASDQYSLGIVVYEWLSGERPFHGSAMEIAAKHYLMPPPPLLEKVPALSPEVEQVVLIALAKDPGRRFATMRAFSTAFEQASRLSPTTIIPLSQPPYSTDARTLPGQPSLAPRVTYPSDDSVPAFEIETPPNSSLMTPTPSQPPQRGISRRAAVRLAGLAVMGAAGGSLAWLIYTHVRKPPGPPPISSPTPSHPPSSTTPTVPPQSITSSGMMYGFDVGHSRFNPDEHILSPTNISRLVVYWTATANNSISSSPTVANGVVYVGSDDYKLYAFNAQTGATLWTAPTGGKVFSSPAIATNGVVYVGSEDGKLYAFNVQTGAMLWASTTGYSIVSSPAVANGMVYIGSRDYKLYAFDAATGATLWIASTGGDLLASPAVAKGVVYIGSRDSKLYAFDAATGTTLWMASTGQGIDASPAVANGIVYNGSRDGNMYAFNATTGALLWTTSTNFIINSSAAVANRTVYVGSRDGNMYAFNATTGATLWTAPTSFRGIETSPMVANGVVYVGSDDGKLYAFNAMKGALLWSFPVGTFYSCPAVANGVVYIGSLVEHKLYAFHLPGTAS